MDGEPIRGATRSPDGTSIAWFRSGTGPPLLLVHGTSADHTTFRAVEPILRQHRTCVAIDRRGRGESGDTLPYSIVREFEDVAAVANQLAGETGEAVDVVGHSYGGRCGLGAALRTRRIRRLVVYEGAPGPSGEEVPRILGPFLDHLRRLLADGHPDDALRAFMREVVGMTPEDLLAYEASPVWGTRVAAAGTIPRELEAATTAREAGLDALVAVDVPVLLVVGGESGRRFRAGMDELAARLPTGRLAVIPGQRHAAHHGEPDRFVEEILAFLDE